MDGHHHVCGLSRPGMKMVRVLGGEGRVVWMKVQLRRTDELEFSCMKRGSILELDRVDVRKRYEKECSIYSRSWRSCASVCCYADINPGGVCIDQI